MKTLANHSLPPNVQQPSYPRDALKSRMVHLGFGAFHRAHQALLTNRVLNQSGGDWGYCEINLIKGEALIEHLRQQNNLYTVLEKGASSNQAIVVGSICDSLHPAFDGILAILEKLAEPQVAIVSLTITEKGYCIEPSRGELDVNNPQIQQDLANPQQPQTAPGVIVEALNLRYQRGLPAFTVLSCDNIPHNGKVVKNAILGLAQVRDSALATWINENVTFPSTMVDRIVPAINDDALHDVAQIIGITDPCATVCEPFIQWVVEDNFVAGRPQWEIAGVELVQDVLPYEAMKLRMLNGSHSFLAYLGYLAGYQHINDCMENPAYRTAAYRLMLQEQAPTLHIHGVDLPNYADKLIERYSNPSLKHRTWQIAMDGTQKLPQRMLDSIRWHLKQGSVFPYLALGVAGWMRYVSGVDDQQIPIDLHDPMKENIQHLVASSSDGVERVSALLTLEAVFGEDLPKQPQFVQAVSEAYLALVKHGAAQVCQQWVAQFHH